MLLLFDVVPQVHDHALSVPVMQMYYWTYMADSSVQEQAVQPLTYASNYLNATAVQVILCCLRSDLPMSVAVNAWEGSQSTCMACDLLHVLCICYAIASPKLPTV
jgi:hypothetical protein